MVKFFLAYMILIFFQKYFRRFEDGIGAAGEVNYLDLPMTPFSFLFYPNKLP
jgi:hypothetical protein